jgi:hypothetical protein
MIVPNKLLSADYASALRNYISTTSTILRVRDYSSVKVFPVSVYPIVYVCAKRRSTDDDTLIYEKMHETGSLPAVSSAVEMPVSLVARGGDWSRLVQGDYVNLIDKLMREGSPLGTLATVSGAATVSEAYSIHPLLSEWARGSGRHLRLLNTGTVDRYAPLWAHFSTRYIKRSYTKPIVLEPQWGRLPPRRLAEAQSPKIIIAGMIKVLECVADNGTTLAGKSTTIVLNPSYPLTYVLGLLNSKVLTFFFQKRFSGLALEGGYFRVGPPQIQLLPIPNPEKSPADGQQLQRDVDEIVDLYEALWAARTAHDRTVIERNVNAMDARIDQAVYRLFSLTPSEIQIIENA